MREDAVYKRLGSHSLTLNYDGKVLVHGAVYSLKIKRALGRFRKFVLNCPARMKETSLAMAVQSYYEPPLRPEAQAWGPHVAENPMACGEATRRSRDGSMGPVYGNLGSMGSGTP